MSTIAVVDVIKQYLMIFGPLLGEIKKEGFIPPILDRLSIVNKYKINLQNLNLIDLGDKGHYVAEGSAKGSARGIYKLNRSIYIVQFAVSNRFH